MRIVVVLHVCDGCGADLTGSAARRRFCTACAQASTRTDPYAEYAERRAQELGFSPAEVLTSHQGRWSEKTAPAREARRRIALELRESGATLDQIGAVFGGLRRPTVHELLKTAKSAVPA